MGFTKLEKSVLNVSALPDKVENQARQLKATFDQAGEDIKEAHNQLIDELDANTAAGNIGAVSAKTGAKTTVQAELDKLNDRIKVDFTELEIDIDDELDTESENAVKNKGIAKEVNAVKGDLYAVDRYNKPTITKGQVSPDGVKVIGNAFPNDWTKVSAVEYTASNGDILTASGSTESTSSYRLNYAVDGEVSTSSHWLSLTSSKVGEHNQWIKIKLNTPINIKKMATFISTASMTLTSAVIQGSNDDEKWYDLYTISSKQTSLTEITLDNNNYYQYYRIYFTGQITSANSGHFIVYEWQTVEYMTKEDQVIHNINLPLTSYEVGKIVNMEGNSYIGKVLLQGNGIVNSWEEVNQNEFISPDGDKLIFKSESTAIKTSTSSADKLYRMVDGNTPNGAGAQFAVTADGNSKATCYIEYSPVIPIGIKTISLFGNTVGDRISYIHLEASDDGDDWTLLHNITEDCSNGMTPININNHKIWQYYRFNIEVNVPSSGTGTFRLYEFQTLEYYQDGQQQTLFENPYLNINNLGVKQINGTIEAGQKYTLVYNGKSWDLLNNVVQGTYSGNSTSSDSAEQFINLGFTPRMVVVANNSYKYSMVAIRNVSFGTNGANQGSSSTGDLFYQSGLGNIRIKENGFVAVGGYASNRGFNYSGVIYNFYAMR